jgi:2-haloacid dehalogenase
MNDKCVDTEVHSISRRGILAFTAAAAAAAAALPFAIRVGDAQAAPAAPTNPSGIKAMTFDIQGTLFDYYQPFARISNALNNRKGLDLNWSGFLGDWNAGAISIVQAIIAGKHAWVPPGQIFRESLDTPLSARELTSRSMMPTASS